MGPIRQNIKRNLIHYLKVRNMTQKELSIKLNTRQSTICGWVNGHCSPDIETIAKICNILNITVIDLFGTDGTSDYTDLEREIINQYRNKPDYQNAVLTLLGIDKNYGQK